MRVCAYACVPVCVCACVCVCVGVCVVFHISMIACACTYPILGKRGVSTSNEPEHRASFLRCIMIAVNTNDHGVLDLEKTAII